MAGEYQLAQSTLVQLIETARSDNSMSEDTLLRALLTTCIESCAKTRSTENILQEVTYLLENVKNDADEEYVITRGC